MRVLFCQMRILLLISFTDLVAKSRFKSNICISSALELEKEVTAIGISQKKALPIARTCMTQYK